MLPAPARSHPSQVFSGFSGKACAVPGVRLGKPVLITMDAYYRGGSSSSTRRGRHRR